MTTSTSFLALGEPVELFSVWDIVFGFLILLGAVALVVGPLWFLSRRRHRSGVQVLAVLAMAACGIVLLVALLAP